MSAHETVRWGILGTANIARASFLPGLRAAGDGVPLAVASRDVTRAERYAAENGLERSYGGYQALLDDEDIDALYIALPNSDHAEWTIKAMEAEKAVLCEKPLTATLPAAEEVLGVAEVRAALLWEAFVFPFREQTERLEGWIRAGRLGQPREIQANFHFHIRNPQGNIRFDPDLGGGALLDVGCYCVRFARQVFQSDVEGGSALASWTPEGVDVEMQGLLAFPHERRLLFSCGMRRPYDASARVLGSEGTVSLTNPYHPGEDDTMELLNADGEVVERYQATGEPSFTACIRHIHRVLWDEEAPRNLAAADALGNAVALDLLTRSAHSRQFEAV